MPSVPSDENLAAMNIIFQQIENINEVAEIFHCSEKTAKRWRAKFNNNAPGEKVQDRRKLRITASKLSQEILDAVVQRIKEHPFEPVKRIPQEMNLGVHEKTLRRNLKKRTNIRFSKPAVKAEIRVADRQTRLLYALDNLA